MVEPAAFKAARPRWGSAGAKSDLGDAYMLADYARTDGHRLRRVEPVEQATRELGALVRARMSLVEARTAASNQLWAILAEHWPGAGVVFQKLTSQVALAFLTDYPTPESAALLGEGRMGQFCRRHAYRGGKSPAVLLGQLRAAPANADPIAPGVLATIVGASVAQIRLLNTEIAALEAGMATALAAHPKAALLESLPRVANVSLAQLIAEIGPLLERCDNPEQVAAMCGAAPVTRASGKSRTVGFRYAANKPARVAMVDSTGRRNTLRWRCWMGRPAGWMKELTGRSPMKSPGAPAHRREVEREFWRVIATGVTSEQAAATVGVSQAVGSRWFRHSGGMSPFDLAALSGRYLSFAEREEIALLRVQGVGVREIARQLGRSPSTISRELRRNAATRGGKLEYRASVAQWKAELVARRPKPAKLASNDRLRDYVQDRLSGQVRCPDGALVEGPVTGPWKGRNKPHRGDRQWVLGWSPEQISQRLT